MSFSFIEIKPKPHSGFTQTVKSNHVIFLELSSFGDPVPTPDSCPWLTGELPAVVFDYFSPLHLRESFGYL